MSGQLSEEEMRQLEAEMERLRIDDVLIQTIYTLINQGAVKAGLAAPPGQEPANRDLDQTKQAIDASRALIPLVGPDHEQQMAPAREALSRLQIEWVRLSGAQPAAPVEDEKDPSGKGPAQSSGRLWVPGQ